MKTWAPYLVLLVVSAIWGAHAVVGVAALRALSPLALSAWRYAFTAVLFAPALVAAAKRLHHLTLSDGLLLLIASLSSAVFYPLFYYRSLAVLPPVESLLIVNAAPVLTALFAYFFYRERLSKRQVIGLVIALLGVVVISLQAATRGTQSLEVIFDAVIGTAAFALYSVVSRKLYMRLPLFDVLAVTSFVGAIFLWLIVLFTHTWSVATALETLRVGEWLSLLFIVLFVSTIAYILYGFGLARVPGAVSAALTFYPQPLFAAILQWIWLGKAVTLLTVIGGAIILTGSFVLRRS
ncbi:DMT family transporter [Sulfoacidibacillus thermotolerans]|uniref:EamA domain-containing protein n=1 Tax=Sulfoacidibacillus thermotolerans TaxID=1765684 RepID=A0A2U3DAU0_SULT2|nr:DMT family transporter [Sulfoacidibacillus thermotolerans]PWI58382.1 hypothetical protein BM613_03980 [Sulfoacidibacillus thermotolerans]